MKKPTALSIAMNIARICASREDSTHEVADVEKVFVEVMMDAKNEDVEAATLRTALNLAKELVEARDWAMDNQAETLLTPLSLMASALAQKSAFTL